MNWDDLKYFLMVCRTGSIRSAANNLGVNHATVSRRINSFEESIGERLFERSAQGYSCTALGQEIYQEACQLEGQINSVERLVSGRDRSMCGSIRLTLPDIIAEHLLMEDFAEFSQRYPDIDLEIIGSSRSFNLASREADIAIRVCKDQPPEHLVGRKLANMHRAVYISRKRLSELDMDKVESELNWIGWNDKMRRPIGKIARDYPRLSSKHRILNAALQMQACRNGMGAAVLPCFMGDSQTDLVRLPPATTASQYELWLLYHPDMRHNRKVQTFVRFITEQLKLKQPLMQGDRPQPYESPIA